MVIMAIDYGDTRTGLAVCDKGEILASPVGTVSSYSDEKLIDLILPEIVSRKVERIVVGKPVNMDGTFGSRAEKCQNFARLLEEKSGIETVLYDERLTTVQAAKELNFTNTRGKKRKNVIDTLSAVIILQNYLDSGLSKKTNKGYL